MINLSLKAYEALKAFKLFLKGLISTAIIPEYSLPSVAPDDLSFRFTPS